MAAALLGGANFVRADRLPVGPVEELRQALRGDVKEGIRTDAGKTFRKTILAKRVAAIQSPGDISQALLLSDWQDGSLASPEIARIDVLERQKLAKRFTTEIRRILEKGDAPSRAAAAGLVGDTATLARERDTQSPAVRAALEELAKDLVQATKDADPRVRLQAIRALGRVQVRSAASAVAPLGALFTSGSLTDRRTAAEALNNMVRILPQVRKTLTSLGITGSGFAVEREDRLKISEATLAAAGKGLTDADPEVRRLCADTLFQTALVLSDSDLISPVRPDIEFAPEGRPLTESEKKDIELNRKVVTAERKELMPLLTAFRDLAPALAAAASDPDPAVRVLAIRTLEEMGTARQKLLWRAASVPDYGPANGGNKNNGDQKKEDGNRKDDGKQGGDAAAQLNSVDDGIRYAAGVIGQRLPPMRLPAGQDPLLDGLEKTLRALAQALNDPKPQVRLAAVDTLETLGDAAAPAAPHLAWALSDPDRFVRWAAARTLGRMSPEKANTEKVVPKLIKMLDDPDLDLRLIAAQSLERFGPAAKAAVPALAKTVGVGDAEIRRAAIRALTGIGTDAAPAVPAIADVLGNADVRVRRTAADSLSRFGALAKPAEPALRKALDDSDAEVRRFAADTLLQIK